MHKIVQEF